MHSVASSLNRPVFSGGCGTALLLPSPASARSSHSATGDYCDGWPAFQSVRRRFVTSLQLATPAPQELPLFRILTAVYRSFVGCNCFCRAPEPTQQIGAHS